MRRVSAKTPEEAEIMIAELQEQRAKESTPPWSRTGAASPPEDDWADFVQTRSVGGSKFYSAPPEPNNDAAATSTSWQNHEPARGAVGQDAWKGTMTINGIDHF